MSRIRIMALRHSAFYSPLLLTIAGGYLRDEGLEPSYGLASAERTVPASIADGSCDLAQSAVATSFPALERGEPVDIVHFAQINGRDGFFIVGRRPEPDFAWQRLKGRRVLVDHFFQPLAMFRYALHRNGMSLGDIDAVDAGGVEAIERAFRDGAADYAHFQGPVPQQLERDGLGHVLAAVGDAVGPVAFSSLCARRDWLTTPAAAAFMRAYRRGLKHAVGGDADEIAALLAAANFFPAIDGAVLSSTISAYQRLACWRPDPLIPPAQYERLLDVFAFSGLITRRHPYEAAIVAPPA
ncbi:MAG: ABC transporter substrate-binding protein [Gammaproteobacteria bacterium]|jgi:NitT/TauT family transport system substrate-binding protein|nr:ABC transporter substrate-binding protein [Gammaproteobacteria bacterium]